MNNSLSKKSEKKFLHETLQNSDSKNLHEALLNLDEKNAYMKSKISNFEIKENEDYFVFPTKVYEEFIKEFKKQLKSIVSLQASNSFYKMICFYSYLVFFLVLLVQLYFYLNR